MKKTLIVIAAAALMPLAASAGDKDKSGSMGPSFDTLDTNRDGRISQAEASADATVVFSTADKNGDGYLDKSEWRAHLKSGTSTQPQPQSMPESTTPESSDQTVPEEPPASEPSPDTETPRQ